MAASVASGDVLESLSIDSEAFCWRELFSLQLLGRRGYGAGLPTIDDGTGCLR